MVKETRVPTPEGKVRRSGLLRQVIHYTLGSAYLARVKEAGGDPQKAATLPNASAVEEESASGVDG